MSDDLNKKISDAFDIYCREDYSDDDGEIDEITMFDISPMDHFSAGYKAAIMSERNDDIREALKDALDVAGDAIIQESGGAKRPSYLDRKNGWSERIRKCREVLDGQKAV